MILSESERYYLNEIKKRDRVKVFKHIIDIFKMNNIEIDNVRFFNKTWSISFNRFNNFYTIHEVFNKDFIEFNTFKYVDGEMKIESLKYNLIALYTRLGLLPNEITLEKYLYALI